ncbi:PLU-1-like protein-domain-containing protein [Calycina marina]|uniref:PLU-1-like protein-domain-containing protein n=1 Tax=Calycina marina TaxID=1763456 RepID=A0A9P7Z3Z0_9HELO|nr:PLU-1-like protein-domain-containing protein [Calycina marina]
MVQVPVSTGASTATMRHSPAASGIHSNATSTKGKPAAAITANNPATAPILPLSAMKSLPLDMTSVERRGQPTASRESSKTLRPHGLTEAPTYRPTEEEFKDPFEYMLKITPEASKYGICKVIPPDSWKPEFAIDTERFHFKTRKQELNSIEGSTRANLTYLDQLAKFHKQHGLNLNRFPSVDKRPLDLFKLKKAVEARGGFEKVCKLKKWAEIGRDLGYSGKIMSSLSTSLKNSYQRWLYPYEQYLRLVKPGVHQQLEYEYGGPLTPSPATSPLKKSHQNTPSSLRPESPAMQASNALNASMMKDEFEKNFRNIPMLDASQHQSPMPPVAMPSAPQPMTSGFTPVNIGGFTPVNAAPATFTPVPSINRRDREENGFTPPRRLYDSPLSSAKNTPDYRPSGLSSTSMLNGFTSNPLLKRQMSHDSLDSRNVSQPPEDLDSEGRRSKRLKKDAVPTVAGSHMTLFRPTPPRVPGERGSSTPGEKCEQCGKKDDIPSFLVCESCDYGYHMYCLDPPVTRKPDFDWHCPRCLVGDGQFGFEEGGIYSLRQFQEKAANFKEGYFQDKMPFDPVLNCPRPVTEDDIEREFWRLVASLEETVEVEYGADIHSTTHGSGFPTIEKNPQDPYATDPWNLNILPYHSDSLFRHIKSDISGMTVPWLYVGMIFSTFCWHNEDHYAYSANYQHFGSTKTWYGIPGGDAEKFEAAMRDAVPELFETQPDLLFQLVTLLTPEQLRKADVNVYAVDQRAGQFVITFPQAYHAGFNHGFNLNEAVNFAPTDWEPKGEAGVQRLQEFRRQPCFSHDELLWTAANGAAAGPLTIHTAKWLAPALERLRGRETLQRDFLLGKHKHDGACKVTGVTDAEAENSPCQIVFKIDDADVPEEEYQCIHCKAYAYMSRFKCEKSGKVMCLLHAGNHECCEMPEEQRYGGLDHTLLFRLSMADIDATYQKVAEKSNLPEEWEKKVEKLLVEDATPSLKSMRTLLNEGERIPYELPSLPMLRKFVERCNEWVEEATNYIVRKQQNRKKNEKAWRKNSKQAELEERDKELRKVENIIKLLDTADNIGFDCPEIETLRERSDAIKTFQRDARTAISNTVLRQTKYFEELLELGRGFNVDTPEIEALDKIVQQMKWNDRAKEIRGQLLNLKEVDDFIEEGIKLEIPGYNDHISHFKDQRAAGMAWDAKANELINAEMIHYPQLEALSNQAQHNNLPVTPETLAAVEQFLHKQREAHKQIISLVERSRSDNIDNRPPYTEVRDTMERLTELNSKPSGTLDLEKEQKRHEDWMRKGKKLFGKANAPLHILKSYMEYVYERNVDCFDIYQDKPRLPAEPASREPTPETARVHSWEDPRFREVFCICRRVEAGMMIECELCHEWYHGKCLKIARGKVKEEEKYTCPICDWRVKIPRDAARPKLEDLQAWQDEIPNLPFQPEEEEVLNKIIQNALDFRNHISPFCNPVMATADEAETQRFYLRKIEGAEILLAYETNFFRQELHKWSPVAPDPPPVLEVSKSTRKPRPTKLQKLMAQHGVDDPEQLPQEVRLKPHQFKRKSSEPQLNLQPAPRRPGSVSMITHSHTFPAVTSAPNQHSHLGTILTGLRDSPSHGHPTQFGGFPNVQDQQYSMSPRDGPRDAFAPHAFMNSGSMASPGGFGNVSPRQTPIFNDRGFGGLDNPVLSGVDAPMSGSFGGLSNNIQPGLGNVTSTGSQDVAVAQMFDELTNQEDDSQGKNQDATKSKDEPADREVEWNGNTGDEDLALFFDP